MRKEFRFAGEGGQGLITAAIILATAAAEHTDYNAVQSQSYGPESRGGASKGDVIISDDEIDYPEIKNPDVLLVMAQEACNKYAPEVRPGGLVIADTLYVKEIPEVDARVFRYPVAQKARELGREIVANVLSLGLVVGLTKIVPEKDLLSAILSRVPKGTEEINKKAFLTGVEASKELV